MVLLGAILLLAGGCSESRERKAMIDRHIDAEWFRKSVIEDNISRWLAAARTPNGFFRSSVDRRWRPAKRQSGTLVSQSRLLYVFATGYELTGERRYLDAVSEGADFLLTSFHDGRHGGWFWSVTPAGEPRGQGKDSYGHAFVIFGLSHAARVTGRRRYADAALYTWDVMKRHLRDEMGGIKRATTRDWRRRRGGNSQNPMMHLFEALLALHDATGSERVFEDAAGLAGFIFGRLYQKDGGFLPEMYTSKWAPRKIGRGGYVDVGHQFEWAFLLARAVEKGFPRWYLDIGNRLLDFGMRAGYDRRRGGIRANCDYEGKPHGGKGWWQQTEHLRALARYAGGLGREELWEPFDKSLQFAKAELIDHEYGGWYGGACPPEKRSERGARKGNVWKVDYHTVGMYAEALRLTGRPMKR